jgi:hypothetical protein
MSLAFGNFGRHYFHENQIFDKKNWVNSYIYSIHGLWIDAVQDAIAFLERLVLTMLE